MIVNGDAWICNSIHDTCVYARCNNAYYGLFVCLFGFTISLKRVVRRPDDGHLCVQQVGESGKDATLPLDGSDSQGQLWKGTGFNVRNIS